MTWILIEPSDVWLFRDGRPFSAGEEHSARCVFPPHPMTIQGVIRSLILGHSTVGWDEFRNQQTTQAQKLARVIGSPPAIGRPASLGTFAMSGPFLAQRIDDQIVRQIPLPADVVCSTDDPPACFTLRPRREQPFDTAWNSKVLASLWPPNDQHIVNPPASVWLPETYLDDYFAGRAIPLVPAAALFEREPRFGIAMDYAKGGAWQPA